MCYNTFQYRDSIWRWRNSLKTLRRVEHTRCAEILELQARNNPLMECSCKGGSPLPVKSYLSTNHYEKNIYNNSNYNSNRISSIWSILRIHSVSGSRNPSNRNNINMTEENKAPEAVEPEAVEETPEVKEEEVTEENGAKAEE